jgi:hypothetical protein
MRKDYDVPHSRIYNHDLCNTHKVTYERGLGRREILIYKPDGQKIRIGYSSSRVEAKDE